MLCLTPAEVATLAEAINPEYRTLIYVAAYTGLRAGDCTSSAGATSTYYAAAST